MLRERPDAYGEHADDFAQRPLAEVARRMVDGNVVGAFIEGKLVGAGGWFHERGLKRQHIATIWGMYVAPDARSQGVGRALLDELLRRIRKAGLDTASLTVSEKNAVARDLYNSAGFKEWGREPDSLRVDGKSITVIHMSRSLRS
jgi:ribosomal protein S18 acetylase RimI-like enzyme